MNEKVHLRAAKFTETPRGLFNSAPLMKRSGDADRRDFLNPNASSIRVIQADPFEESLPAAVAPAATAGAAKLFSTETSHSQNASQKQEDDSHSWVQRMFGESRDIVNTRNYRKWRSMKARNFTDFFRDHELTFLRRMRRGVPQKFRWEVWKIVTGLNAVLQSSTAECVLQYLPLDVSSGTNTISFSSSSSSSSNASSSQNGGTGQISSQELHQLATTVTPAELFKILASKPSKFASLIDIDLNRTFPEIPLFDAKVQRSLHAILNAYANFAPHVGYCQGMNFVMGFILLVSDFAEDVEAFWFFAIMMSRYHLHGFFREGFPLLGVYISTFDDLSEYYAPELRQHFSQESVLPPVYLHQWYLTLFVTSLPLGTVVVIWDFLLCSGLSALLPLTIALLKVLQSFLMRLRFEGIVKFLKSLRLSGDCDESKIGKMLVKHAENYPIPDKFLPAVAHIDFVKLLQESSKDKGLHQKLLRAPSLVDFDSILVNNRDSNEPNPLNTAMQDQGLNADDDDEDDSYVPLKDSAQSPHEQTRDHNRRHRNTAPTQTDAAAGRSGGLSKRFLPKVIGRKL